MIVIESRATTILFNLLRTGPEGVWLLPANVCPIVPLAFLKARRSFELVDIDPRSLCIDPAETLARLRARRGRYAGLLFVRTYGLDRSFETFFAEVRRAAPELTLVDDRCLCWPSFDESGPGIADVELFSTGYSKPVDVGSGGYALLRSGLPYESSRLPFEREHLDALVAMYKRAIVSGERMGPVDSDWLDTRAPGWAPAEFRARVEREVGTAREHKDRLNAIYRHALPESIRLPGGPDTWRFQIRVPDKAGLLADLFAAGLFASSHYASLAGILDDTRAPVAERLHGEIVNLFNDRYFDEERARRTVEIVRRHLGRG